MKIKFYTKLLLIMGLAGQCFAATVLSNDPDLCSGGRFVLGHHEKRRDLFNEEPENESRYTVRTTAINGFLTTGKVTAKRASMATKQAVACAIFGTAITHKGQVTTLSDHFETLKKTHAFYSHYKVLSLIERLGNCVVTSMFSHQNPDEGIIIPCLTELYRLSGLHESTIQEWFGLTATEHKKGWDILMPPKEVHESYPYQDEDDIYIRNDCDGPIYEQEEPDSIRNAITFFNQNQEDKAKILLAEVRDDIRLSLPNDWMDIVLYDYNRIKAATLLLMIDDKQKNLIDSIDASFKKLRDIAEKKGPFARGREVNDTSYTPDIYYVFRAITSFQMDDELGFDAAMELFYCQADKNNPYIYRKEGIDYLTTMKNNGNQRANYIFDYWGRYSTLLSCYGEKGEDLGKCMLPI